MSIEVFAKRARERRTTHNVVHVDSSYLILSNTCSFIIDRPMKNYNRFDDNFYN